jgi:signal transduction histidine kinase
VGLAVGTALFLTKIYLAISAPYLGFSTEPGHIGVLITHVDESSPGHGALARGDEVIAIASDQGEMALEPLDAVREPDDSRLYTSYNRFFERQARIWEIVNAPRLSLTFIRAVAGQTPASAPQQVIISLDRPHQIGNLPVTFWYQLLCGVAIFWMGMAVWAFTQKERGPFLYAVAGFGIGVAIISSAAYTSRTLVLPADIFLFLSRANQLGAMTFAGAGTALLWYYPTQIQRFRFDCFVLVTVSLILLVNWNQWVDSLDVTARYPLIAWGLSGAVLAAVQWHRTRRAPVERARLKWFVYAWFGGITGYLGLVVVPQLIGEESIIHQQYAWGLFVLTYLGIALGIVRYRLFDLDRWILKAWFWFACGILILLMDGILLIWLNLQHTLSLTISVVLVGWIYFPMRQWLQGLVMPGTRDTSWEQFSRIISRAFSADGNASIDDRWRRMLDHTLSPLQTSDAAKACSAPVIADNGLCLRTPLVDGPGSLEFTYASQGQRLFDREDLHLVVNALSLFRYAQQYRSSFEQAIAMERQRVARDLHDDVGARLLSIIYRTEDSELNGIARECLHELRDVIQGLQKEAVAVEQSFSRWHLEARARCEQVGVELRVALAPSAAEMILTPRAERNLGSIVREFITNSLRHARASCVSISLASQDNNLVLDVSDDGLGWWLDMTSSDFGIGLHSIRARCEELDGQMGLYCPVSKGAAIRCVIPDTMEARS